MKAQKIFVKFSILMLFLLAGPSPGLGANDEALPLSSQIMEMVENAQAELTRGSLSSDGFQRLKEKTDQFDTKVKGQLDISQAKREAIKAQLEALGPPPDVEKGEEEPVDLAQSRKSITASLRKIQAELLNCGSPRSESLSWPRNCPMRQKKILSPTSSPDSHRSFRHLFGRVIFRP